METCGGSQVQRGGVDLEEIIRDGIRARYADPKERFQAYFAAADTLKNAATASEIGGSIRQQLNSESPTGWAREVINAGLCPSCGAELEDHQISQAHPYGNTVTLERQSVKVCPHCGEM